MADKRNGTMYIGVTGDLPGRAWQHKQGIADGFTQKYKLHMLVYYELHESMAAAILREKQIKKMEKNMEKAVNRKGEFTMAGFV